MTIKKNDKFNMLTAIKFVEKKSKKYQYWLFRCDCGIEKIIYVDSVKTGHTKSCGCLIGGKIKHGMSGTKINFIWRGIIQRCLNKNNKSYKNYGGRGITICEEWLDFENFYKDMGDKPKGKSVDRIKNNKGYCKKNCRWATPKEQNNNSRHNRLIAYKGKTQTMKQWSEELNISYDKISWRIRNGWNISEVFRG